ncbi:WD domain, G-beta repeat [Aquisphaera giovannonii]|uniref:WD domain, G-beta repeat n=1 Tax=Aquisphaera giovannonii TaxID=406548 RepID=A0A5B9WFW1_9BACT|nr:WD40 repeat domain-containing protein [Aquisphaera giovannonii]QEH39134.1 WD domain, G-beta repeat [Aquisphaera giovannonii]
MQHVSTVHQGWPIAKLRFHPSERLLASVAGPHAEVAIWTWDESGSLSRLASLRPAGETRVADVAWHPRENLLALVGGGRAIELWSEGRLSSTLGQHPVPGRVREHLTGTWAGGKFEPRLYTERIPVDGQGYSAAVFSSSGDRLAASPFGHDPHGDEPTEVYDVASGTLVDSFWRSDSSLVLHPEGEIIATLSSNQGATAVRFGLLGDTFQGYDAQLNVIVDGYDRLVFSSHGDAFAVMGHSYRVGFRIYEFPSCRLLFELDFETLEEMWAHLWQEYRDSLAFTARPDGRYPYEFIAKLWTVKDRLSFHPGGHTLLIGTMKGHVVGVDPDDTSKPAGVWTCHDGPLLALDVSAYHCVLATARFDGELKLWNLNGAPLPAPCGKPMTEAFLRTFQPIDSAAPEEQFRTTDGRRWYNLETIGEEELDDDAPPWAQIARWMRRADGPEA